jgi:precorrin-6x reductase
MPIPTTDDRRPTTILVLAGTRDGRDLAVALAAAGREVLVSAATPYGADLLRAAAPGLAVREGRLDRAALEKLLRSGPVQGILDATHPFAVEVSRLAQEAALNCNVPYLRWERQSAALPDSPLVRPVSGWPEAAEELAALGARQIFLAVGVKPLEAIINHPALAGCRFMVRVLPVSESLEACRSLGLSPGQIVAYQGSGTVKLNEALLEACGAEALVIKESGREGGTADKVSAALNLNIPVVVVGRPGAGLHDQDGGRNGRQQERLSGREPVLTARRQEEVLGWAAGLT